ncbi:MAG: carboxypeptidase regulatory-like domain-containing protein [Chloroflexota bacterium]
MKRFWLAVQRLSLLVFCLLQISAQTVEPEEVTDPLRLLAYGAVAPERLGGEAEARVPTTAVPLPNELAFSRLLNDDFDIYQQTETGETAVSLVENAATPAWSPDGSQLLFSRWQGDNYEVFLRDANGVIHNLSNHPSHDFHPAWHPNGQSILFASDRADGLFQIYQMDVAGGNVQRIGNVSGNHTLFPQMSPDGSRISYMRASILDIPCSWNWDIWLMNADGSGERRITNYFRADVFARWAPNGGELVYASCGAFAYDLYQRNPDSGAEIQLTDTLLDSEWLGVYTPAGEKLAYASSAPGDSQIFMQSAGGGDVVQVTNVAGEVTWPSWRPTTAGGSIISGQVTAFGGQPLTGVSVTNGEGQTAVTDDNGIYRFTGLADGDYTITAQHDSYQFDPASHAIIVPPNAVGRAFMGKDCEDATAETPVLLVTGWSGSESDSLYRDQQLQYMIASLREAGYVEGCNLFYADETTPRENLAENGRIIRDNLCAYAADVAAHNSNWSGEFHIVAHSYGGLRSRAYLENDDLAGSCPSNGHTISVSKLITMGTPHGGGTPDMPLAAYIGVASILRGSEWPAIFEMLPPVRFFQNAISSQPEGVCYHLLGGDAREQWPIFLSVAALYYYTGYGATVLSEPNDLAVRLNSAHMLADPLFANQYRGVTTIETPDLHGKLPYTESLPLRSFVYPVTTFNEVIHPLLANEGCGVQRRSVAEKTAVSQTRWQAIKALPQTNPQPSLPLLDIDGGVLAVDGATSGSFELTSAGKTGIALHWTAGQLSLTLTDPAGRVIDMETAVSDNNITYSELNGGLGWLASYTLEDAAAGSWQYEIRNREAAEEGGSQTAVYRLVLLPATPIGTNIAVPDWLPHGSVVPITAAVTFDNSDPVTDSLVIANVTRPDGSRHSLTLLDDGQSGDGAANDGVYGGHFGPAIQGGVYGVALEATGTYQGEAFTRSTTAVFTIAPPKASFTNSYTDMGIAGGEYYQQLAVDVGVIVNEPSRFTLTAELYAGDQFVTQTTTVGQLSPGDQTIRLLFDGQAIRESGLDGPYTVRHLLLLDNDPLPLLIESVEVGGGTAPYTHDQFGRLWRTYLPTLPK